MAREIVALALSSLFSIDVAAVVRGSGLLSNGTYLRKTGARCRQLVSRLHPCRTPDSSVLTIGLYSLLFVRGYSYRSNCVNALKQQNEGLILAESSSFLFCFEKF